MLELLRDTYRYRELIWALAIRELKVRYKRSVSGSLGAAESGVAYVSAHAGVFDAHVDEHSSLRSLSPQHSSAVDIF